MKSFINSAKSLLSVRVISPVIIGLFLLIYIGIAFLIEDALITLMNITRSNPLLVALLALLPIIALFRIFKELRSYFARKSFLAGKMAEPKQDLFDEKLELPASANSSFETLNQRLLSEGYRTICRKNSLTAWRGFSQISSRILYLAAVFALFAGILISLTTRDSNRITLIEGEQLPDSDGVVDKIVLAESGGAILAKKLAIEIVQPATGNRKVFGIYPPSLYQGAFVYPRYLGVGLVLRFSAPDLPEYKKNAILNIHPPGKEDTLEIPGSQYRLVITLASPLDGSDPYVTGKMSFIFKLMKAKDVLLTGSAAAGAEFVKDGYRIVLPDARRLVITDFIQDYGVFFIWVSMLLFIATMLVWLPIRLLMPRREILFILSDNLIKAYSRTEGKTRRHAGIFHEALDTLETLERTSG